jgi:hypothetical protein
VAERRCLNAVTRVHDVAVGRHDECGGTARDRRGAVEDGKDRRRGGCALLCDHERGRHDHKRSNDRSDQEAPTPPARTHSSILPAPTTAVNAPIDTAYVRWITER